jgi:hypothetical protein
VTDPKNFPEVGRKRNAFYPGEPFGGVELKNKLPVAIHFELSAEFGRITVASSFR